MKSFFWIFIYFLLITSTISEPDTTITCKDPFDDPSLGEALSTCLKKIAKKSHCGGSYDLQCLCDSDHFVYSTLYVKTYSDCFRALSSEQHYNFTLYFKQLCKDPKPANDVCIRLNTPPKPILCSDPFEGIKWGERLLTCIKNSATKSLCKPSNDANCLCDSQSFWSGVNKCLVIEDLSKLAMTQEFRKSLCHEPRTLPGCADKSIIVPDCPSIFENSNLNRQLKTCLKEIAKNTYCGRDVDPVCLCDSKVFMDVTNNLNTYSACFWKLSSDIHSQYKKFRIDLCKNPKPPSQCILKDITPSDPVICYDLYKDINLSENLKKCMILAAKNSLCGEHYDVLCLCDSLSYLNAVDACIKSEDDENRKLVQNYINFMCKNPTSLSGCSKKNKLLTSCKDVFEESNFKDDMKDCLRKIAKKTRCGGSYDATCLCNSVEYTDSTLFIHTYAKCFRMFTVDEHLSYSDFHNIMCKKPQSPSIQCAQLQMPTKKPILCTDVYKNIKLQGKLMDCIKNALKKSFCKEPYDAVCLCDSQSYWRAIGICSITTTNEEYKILKDYRDILCKKPTSLPGCNPNYSPESVNTLDEDLSSSITSTTIDSKNSTSIIITETITDLQTIINYIPTSKNFITPGTTILASGNSQFIKNISVMYFITGIIVIITIL